MLGRKKKYTHKPFNQFNEMETKGFQQDRYNNTSTYVKKGKKETIHYMIYLIWIVYAVVSNTASVPWNGSVPAYVYKY